MANDTIDFDLNCVGCDYNLRGIAAGAACPECGHRVLDSIAEQLRRRTPLKVEHARFADRPAEALRSIRDAGVYAVVANAIAATWLIVPASMSQRKSPGRYVLLALLCVALACAAMSIWRLAIPPHRPSRRGSVARSLMRSGAISALLLVCHTTFTNDRDTFWGYIGLWPGQTIEYASIALSWAIAIGMTLRVAYAQWWLRLEGKSLIAWPLMLAAIPTIFWYAIVSMSYWYRGNFVSLEYFSEQPFVSHAWPVFYREAPRELLRPYVGLVLLFAFLLLGQIVVIVADATLARLASRALKARPA